MTWPTSPEMRRNAIAEARLLVELYKDRELGWAKLRDRGYDMSELSPGRRALVLLGHVVAELDLLIMRAG